MMKHHRIGNWLSVFVAIWLLGMSMVAAAGPTTTTITANPTSAPANQSIAFTITVTGTSPWGYVRVFDGAGDIGTYTLTGTGSTRTATFNRSFTIGGTHNITAAYQGDTDDATSTSEVTSITITQVATTTTLTANPTSALVNQNVVLVATVAGFTPSGAVTFKDGTTTIGTVNTTGSGTSRTATLNRTFSTTGVHNITAVYAGDPEDATSTSAVTNVTVSQATTNTVVTANPASALVNESIAFTITVTGSSPWGYVTVYNNGTANLGTFSLSGTGSTRTATFNRAFSTTGMRNITAVYQGDADDASSTSAVTNVPVRNATTATLSAPNTANLNQSVDLTATIAGYTPTGTVTFKDGTSTLGTVALSGSGTSGTATFNASFSTAGIHALTVEYTGDADDAPSISTTKNTTVSSNTNTVLSADSSTVAINGNITYTATVTGANPTGAVSFKESGNTVGTANLANVNGAMKATFTTSFPSAGSYNLTANYAGDTQNLPSSSSPLLVTVSGAPTIHYIYTDQLDTPRLITDAANNPVWRWDNNDPFGNNAVNDDPNNTGNHFKFNQRFPGQYYDVETNKHYNYYRDYDPQTGRYIESDPIGLAGGINTYAYVGGNPLKWSDPTGLAVPALIVEFCVTNPVACGVPIAIATKACVDTYDAVRKWLENNPGAILATPPDNAYDPNGPKAPGKPGVDEGFKDPKGGDDWVKNPNGSGNGWRDKEGNVWVPTGPGGEAHGGEHWDVQRPDGTHVNVYPGGHRR